VQTGGKTPQRIDGGSFNGKKAIEGKKMTSFWGIKRGEESVREKNRKKIISVNTPRATKKNRYCKGQHFRFLRKEKNIS